MEYSTNKKAAIDLGNDLLRDESWDTIDLNSQHRNLLTDEDKQHSADNLENLDPLAVDNTDIKG